LNCIYEKVELIAGNAYNEQFVIFHVIAIMGSCIFGGENNMSYSVELKKVHIKNFRSIVDETIDFDRFNIFVGLNDCGKSNVLKALNLFFNGVTENNHPLEFSKDYCQHGKTGKGKAKEIVIEVTLKVPANFSEKGTKIWKKVWRDNEFISNNLTDIFKKSSKCVTLFKRIHFEYIPAVKSVDFFQDLLLKLYDSMVHSADSTLLKVNKAYSKALSELTKDFSDNIKSKVDVESVVRMPDNLATLFRSMKISTEDKNVKNVDLDYRGDGIKARHIPSILLTIARNIKNSRKKNSIDYTFIWGYEEPENGVEFSACTKLMDELYSYSFEMQIILTTHSPAMYSAKDRANAKCYYTYRTENGSSKYESNYSVIELNKNIGLMPLITPYIETARKEIEERTNENIALSEKLEKMESENRQILLFTEGKTDVEYLKLAFDKFQEFSLVQSRVQYYDIAHAAKTGDSELLKIFEYLQKGYDNNIKICIFDRDASSFIFENEYEERKNKVFRFNIPIPTYRNSSDGISIEHFLTDEELKIEDSKGRRIFLAKEFDERGISWDKQYTCKYANKSGKGIYINPLEILNGSGDKKVYKISDDSEINYALSKDDFVKHIIDKEDGFDFDLKEYRAILEIIKKIAVKAEANMGE